jgi:uncharacterized membrane-anchored protein
LGTRGLFWSVLIAMIVHTALNASSQIWNATPEYSGGRLSMSAADAAATTVHINHMVAIALWVGAIVAVLVYGPRNLSRHPRRVLCAASAESHEPTTSRVRR